MSKIPVESRPLRLAPELAQSIEERLESLNGKELKAAQEAVLRVYQSGVQLPLEQWIARYDDAITNAVKPGRA